MFTDEIPTLSDAVVVIVTLSLVVGEEGECVTETVGGVVSLG